ncbi:hypothetical protein GOP47_0005090 [Adiantum capillus-veneris]|uniref:Uncharacterized protein n=1 Tax=Adiantum capillus-veneris TaxID=13818 RepID=A0A9D4V5B7_ADICA|nr:hypothetical protein GOP47_0005090 [Adiantum capillus-veneris]
MGLKMMCVCSSEQFKADRDPIAAMAAQDMAAASGLSTKTIEGEAKLDEGNIEEAESSLREALSLNYEEARALLGRLEYQRGNVEAALQVFDGIDISTVRSRMKASITSKSSQRRGRSKNDISHSLSLHAASLLLEAIYLKAKSLQKLGRLTDAALECKGILDTVDVVFPQGMPDSLGESKLQETISNTVELLPELWKQAGQYHEAMPAYRRALLHQWNLNPESCARIQKEFAILLLYGGVEAGAPSLASQGEGSFVPKNNLEESILLLMILLRKISLRRIAWDSTVLEHLTFALSMCGQTETLAMQYEEVLPGIFSRADRWYNLALCYSGVGKNKLALGLLEKSLHHLEKPNDISALLLAAKLSCEDNDTSSNAMQYAHRAIANMKEDSHSRKCVAYHILGSSMGKQARLASLNTQRAFLQRESLKALQDSAMLDGENAGTYFDLALEYAEQRNLTAALDCAKKYLDLTGGSEVQGWRLLGLILSAQQRYSDAENVLNVALDETGTWEQGELLRTKAKLQMIQGKSTEGIKTYMRLLALVQAQRKSFNARSLKAKVDGEKVSEVDVWQDLAGVYTTIAAWHDAEVCLEKAKSLKLHSAATWHATGVLYEARGQLPEASASYYNGLAMDPDHVPCKVSLGALLRRSGGESLPVARSFLTDALRLNPTNHMAWYNLGMVHKLGGRPSDAADCFQTAYLLEQSAPVEEFSSLAACV